MNSALLLTGQARVTFGNKLLGWYQSNQRELPWRKTDDPYQVWVSEIMLQQTRVGAVLEHYRRFLDRFPTVEALARAREQSVLAAWSGLGYYRRARNLHLAAKVVVSGHAGIFPKTSAELRQLPGIGRYTAAAIASIAFGEPTAVVDGNVERVLQRVTGDPRLPSRETWELANLLLNPRRPGDFNQAMMELGATVCLPREPKCGECPIIGFCKTRAAHKNGERTERKTVTAAYSLVHHDGSVWLTQRPSDASLMAGMWELPPQAEVNGTKLLLRVKHSILNTGYDVQVFEGAGEIGNGRWIRNERLPRMALTGLARKVLRRLALLK